MKKFSRLMILAVTSALAGCGASAKGPAKPEDTPVVSQEEVQETYKKGMSSEQMKMYGDKMKKGGS